MSDWRRGFRVTLLDAWRAGGLPDPARHEQRYDALLRAAEPPLPRDGEGTASAGGGPLDPRTLGAVHGFGHVAGTALAQMLAIDDREAAAAVAWCARFNLGISLFDWLCDEGGVQAQQLGSLPALARLGGRRGSPAPAAAQVDGDVTRFLDALVRELLDELAEVLGPPRTHEPPGALWPSLRRLMRAELRVGQAGSFDPMRPRALLPEARLASVEPFRVMAERIVHARLAPTRGTIELARRAGRAIGACIWLADDADDVWRDLDRSVANRFLIETAVADPRVITGDGSALVDLAVLRVLRREAIAERLCRGAVRRLAAVLRTAPCEPAARAEAAGLIGVALARWSA